MLTVHDTSVMKGVAILLMLFLHLFNGLDNVALCMTCVSINDIPLVHLLTRCANPVPFYIILSGYGLYISYVKGKVNNLKRVTRLYVHYWISMIIFVTIGFLLCGSDIYPGSGVKILENVTGWHTTYNGQIWFLFPYVLVTISSPVIFKFIDKFNPWAAFIATGVIYFLAYCAVSFYGVTYLYSHQLAYMPVLYLSFLFPFSVGVIMSKYDIIGKVNIKGYIALVLLLVLVVLRCCVDTRFFDPLYAAIFIMLFMQINRPRWLDSFLNEMGRRSTSMWFVHSYFCYHLFKSFIYGFKYPIVIFIVLLAVSYLTAVVIDWLNVRLQTLIGLKK